MGNDQCMVLRCTDRRVAGGATGLLPAYRNYRPGPLITTPASRMSCQWVGASRARTGDSMNSSTVFHLDVATTPPLLDLLAPLWAPRAHWSQGSVPAGCHPRPPLPWVAAPHPFAVVPRLVSFPYFSLPGFVLPPCRLFQSSSSASSPREEQPSCERRVSRGFN